ncbi:metallophosphoesterase [Cellulomonas sp. PhB143]|uniref:metallophosphoesterase family protein n=1 Tax=Cellulomonas sp. PhB143 TaxID=2485186 RepID=UPI000FB12AD9|nr:metallophosphoesterase [Cellulomonas sp. PhB143]ROS73638.1 Icc-related predicted phosphoesterase [Cellulomonas sp. PhB143]
MFSRRSADPSDAEKPATPEVEKPAPSETEKADAPEPRAPRRRRAWVRWTLLGIALFLLSATFGVTTASADLSLGPHEARYEVTTDGLARVDLGPLGSLEIDSPVPLGLGVDVTVGEIPDELHEVDAAATLDALAGDAQSYLQFFSSPQVTLDLVVHDLVRDAAVRTLMAFLVCAVVAVGLRFLLGGARRRQLAGALAPRTWDLAAGGLVVVLVGATLSSGAIRSPEPEGEPSPVFAGTALEGARITGRLSGVVDTYGEQLLDTYRDNEKFYEVADHHLSTAWDDRLDAQRYDALAASTGFRGPVVPAAADDDYRTVVVVSDLHCNTAMAPLISTTIAKAGADVVLDAGDTTMNGTSVEEVCVSAVAGAVPDDVPLVVSDGNHDSDETSAQERKAGATVLEGKVVDVDGIRILGDHDALRTSVVGGSGAKDEAVTPDDQAAQLATTACEKEPVDLLLIHTPRVGDASLESGCVPMQISGHLHRRVDPVQVGSGIQYVSSSTAGAVLDKPTVGPLHGTAEMTVLRFDPDAHRFVDYQVVAVTPEQKASVGPRIPVPVPTPVPATAPTAASPAASPPSP